MSKRGYQIAGQAPRGPSILLPGSTPHKPRTPSWNHSIQASVAQRDAPKPVATNPDGSSWWVGKSRADLAREVAARGPSQNAQSGAMPVREL
jgi:hypothetical protein